MRHSSRPDNAACPRLLDGVDAGLDSDLVGEMITVPTIRARRSSAAKVSHAGYSNPLTVRRFQPDVLAAAAPRRPAKPLAAAQIALQAVGYLRARSAGHRVPHGVGDGAAGTSRGGMGRPGAGR